jgi:hypothetical protein
MSLQGPHPPAPPFAGEEARRPPARPGPIRHSLKSPGGMSGPGRIAHPQGSLRGKAKGRQTSDRFLGTRIDPFGFFLRFNRRASLGARPTPPQALVIFAAIALVGPEDPATITDATTAARRD